MIDQMPLVIPLPVVQSASLAVFGETYLEGLLYTAADLAVASKCSAIAAIGDYSDSSESLSESDPLRPATSELPLSVARFSIVSDLLEEITKFSSLITEIGLYAQTTAIIMLLESNEIEGWDRLRAFAANYAGNVSRLVDPMITQATDEKQVLQLIRDAWAAANVYSDSPWTSDDDTLLLGSRRQLLASLVAVERATLTSSSHISALAELTALLSSFGDEAEAAEFERPLYLLLAGAVRSLLKADR